MAAKKKAEKRPRGRPKKQSHEETVIKLMSRLGLHRQTFYNWENYLGFPKKEKAGYPIEKFRDFFLDVGVLAKKSIEEKKSLLLDKDLEIKSINIKKQHGQLIEREEHNRELLQLATAVRKHLDNLSIKLSVIYPSVIGLEAEAQKTVDEILISICDVLRGIDGRDIKG